MRSLCLENSKRKDVNKKENVVRGPHGSNRGPYLIAKPSCYPFSHDDNDVIVEHFDRVGSDRRSFVLVILLNYALISKQSQIKCTKGTTTGYNVRVHSENFCIVAVVWPLRDRQKRDL